MDLLTRGGVDDRAGALVGVDGWTVVVVVERVDALELVRAGICCGRGRW